jgi:F0F1-type ATP synthase assembly protein I
MASKSDRSAESRGFGAGYAIVAAGFQLAFAVVLFLGAGLLVDRWLHTKPAFTLLGVLVGLAAGMYAFLRQVKAESPGGADDPEDAPRKPGRPDPGGRSPRR